MMDKYVELMRLTGNFSISPRGQASHSSDRESAAEHLETKLTALLSFITLPFAERDPKAIEIVQVILESILLRREKTMRDSDGKKIVDLPPKEVCALLSTIACSNRDDIGHRRAPRILTTGKKNL